MILTANSVALTVDHVVVITLHVKVIALHKTVTALHAVTKDVNAWMDMVPNAVMLAKARVVAPQAAVTIASVLVVVTVVEKIARAVLTLAINLSVVDSPNLSKRDVEARVVVAIAMAVSVWAMVATATMEAVPETTVAMVAKQAMVVK